MRDASAQDSRVTMGASPRLHRHTPASARAMVVATMVIALLGVSCAERDPADGGSSAESVDGWSVAYEAAFGRLDDAIGQIFSAVDGNDVRLLGAGPERCVAEASPLAEAAHEAGAVIDGERLEAVAALCLWLQGPAAVHDVNGVVNTLDPLFTAVGRIAPLLERPDSLS